MNLTVYPVIGLKPQRNIPGIPSPMDGGGVAGIFIQKAQ